MALFSNEPEKNGQPLNPQVIPVQPATAIPSPERSIEPQQMASNQGSAYLDRGTKAAGKLHFEGPVRIDGEVEGDIHGKSITIGESATVTAQITADFVVVCGKLKGEINASQRIEIRATARVQGNLAAPKLMIHEGAIFDGNCAIESHDASNDRNRAPDKVEERKGAHGDSPAIA